METKKTIEDVKNEVAILTSEQQQLLKDTIIFGTWGDGDYEFINAEGEIKAAHMYGYRTNDAKKAGNFSGRQVSAMFRAIYAKLCPKGVGRIISHHSDWWGNGSGDMLFIRGEYVGAFKKWAKQK